MSITYYTDPEQWSPGYMAVHIHDDGRYAVVIDGRPVFSGSGYVPGLFHDDRMQVADILFFAYWAAGDGRVPGAIWPDDLAVIGDEMDNVT